ncbi:MAG: hypothetical protein ACLUD2_07555 [Clostridium sp.]
MVLPLSHIPLPPSARIIWIASEPARREKPPGRALFPMKPYTACAVPSEGGSFYSGVRGRLILLPRKLAGEIFAEIQRLIFQKQMLNNFYQTQYNGKNFQQEET